MVGCGRIESVEQVLGHPNRQAILAALKETPGIGLSSISRKVGLNKTNVGHHLLKLRKYGYVRVVGCKYHPDTPMREKLAGRRNPRA